MATRIYSNNSSCVCARLNSLSWHYCPFLILTGVSSISQWKYIIYTHSVSLLPSDWFSSVSSCVQTPLQPFYLYIYIYIHIYISRFLYKKQRACIHSSLCCCCSTCTSTTTKFHQFQANYCRHVRTLVS